MASSPTRMRVFLVAGARPNFVKVAPIYHVMAATPEIDVQFVHTGQHADAALSDVFLHDLGLPRPDVWLGGGSGPHGAQTARILGRFEAALIKRRPDLVVVVGDVNSTLACALAVTKVVYPDGRRPALAHVEAGLRSFDRTMPEEINRVVTDALADVLFVTERSAMANLAAEGVDPARVFMVGNVMIDTLLARREDFIALRAWERVGRKHREYGVVTLHRPSNVDDPQHLRALLGALAEVADRLPLVFPVHPRTRRGVEHIDATPAARLQLVDPLPYSEFMSLVSGARLVLTDSGGVQEETTVMGVPCLTLRPATERPVTVEAGTNLVIGTDPRDIVAAAHEVLNSPMPTSRRPELWDGRAADRIVRALVHRYAGTARVGRATLG